MTNQKKLSRREAIKVLGAATGASLLANIPAKWSRPEVTGSPLPAFAQTSCYDVTVAHVDSNGSYSVYYQSNTPDSTGPSNQLPYQWLCRTGCLYLVISFGTATSVELEITTVAGVSPLILTFETDLLINVETGEFGIDQDPVNGCSWPIR